MCSINTEGTEFFDLHAAVQFGDVIVPFGAIIAVIASLVGVGKKKEARFVAC